MDLPNHEPRTGAKPWIKRNAGTIVVAGIVMALLALQMPIVRGLFVGPAGKESLDGWHRTFAPASASAKEQSRPLLLRFTADWCPPCQVMKREAWPDERVQQLVKDRYVPVYVDIDTPDGGQLAQKYGVGSIPTLIVADGEGKMLRYSNFVDADGLVEFLEQR
jgi:protein disulfide-isomerase